MPPNPKGNGFPRAILMTYARIVDGVLDTKYPTYFKEEGEIISNPTVAEYKAHGWKIFVRPTTPPVSPKEGYHFEVDGWQEDNNSIYPKWGLVADAPPPPKVYDKYNLLAALKVAGYLTAFLTLLNSSPETMALWNAADDLPEEDPLFQQVLAAAKEQLHLTDEDIERILEQAQK